MMIAQWAVGFIVTLLVLKIIKGNFTGWIALAMLTVVPWGVGKFLFQLVEALQSSCK